MLLPECLPGWIPENDLAHFVIEERARERTAAMEEREARLARGDKLKGKALAGISINLKLRCKFCDGNSLKWSIRASYPCPLGYFSSVLQQVC